MRSLWRVMVCRMLGLRRWEGVVVDRRCVYRVGSCWMKVHRGGRLVLAVSGWYPVADVAIALSTAEVSRCTDAVVGDIEFDVLTKVCPGLVRMVGL